MGQVKNKQAIVHKTILALELGINHFKKQSPEQYDYEFFKESLIQRFKYTIDTFWKYLKLYMQDYQKLIVDVASPRGVFRTAAEAKLISRQELDQLLDAATDRNLSSHAYDEDVAQEVVERIPKHFAIIKTVFERIEIK